MSAGRGPLLAVDELRGEIFTSSAQPLTAVDDVSFALARGEILALVGESGSGKSMVAAAILGLVDPPGRIVGGSMLFGSRELRGLSDRQLRGLRGDRLAMLFAGATTALNPMLRIDAQMIESLRAHRIISRSAARERCPVALARVGVAAPQECLRAYPNELPAGTRARVAIAIAFLHGPELIVADEPTLGLDLIVRAHIVVLLRKLVRDSGAALIWTTQDITMTSRLAERICVMYAGRIVEEGAADEVLSRPRHPYTRGLIDSTATHAAPRERLRQINGIAPSLGDLASGCAYRPRCPYATVECAEPVTLRAVGADRRRVRCIHPLRTQED